MNERLFAFGLLEIWNASSDAIKTLIRQARGLTTGKSPPT